MKISTLLGLLVSLSSLGAARSDVDAGFNGSACSSPGRKVSGLIYPHSTRWSSDNSSSHNAYVECVVFNSGSLPQNVRMISVGRNNAAVNAKAGVGTVLNTDQAQLAEGESLTVKWETKAEGTIPRSVTIEVCESEGAVVAGCTFYWVQSGGNIALTHPVTIAGGRPF